MPFRYNPHRHVKIWLTKNPKSFLNFENQLRLIRMRNTNPSDEINFVYDSTLLNPEALKDLTDFCSKHNILAHDLRELFKKCQTEEETKLIQVYENEIQALNHGGNLAAASDILRWISPIYSLGTYTDFDINIDTSKKSKLPATLVVESDLLINIGTVISPYGNEMPVTNNDFIAVVNSDSAKDKLTNIQNSIYLAYTKTSEEGTPYNDISAKILEDHRSLFVLYYTDIAKRWPLFSLFKKYVISNASVQATEMRPIILALGALRMQCPNETNLGLRKNFIEQVDKDDFIKTHIFKGTAEDYRKKFKKQLTWFNWLFLPPYIYQEYKKIIGMDDTTLLASTRQTILDQFMKHVVVNTTGPHLVGEALDDVSSIEDRKKMSIYHPATYSAQTKVQYRLNEYFKVTNTVPIGVSTKQFFALCFNPKSQEKADSSWLASGENRIKEHEEKMNISAIKISKILKKNVALKKEERLPKSQQQKGQSLQSKSSAGLTGFAGLTYFFKIKKTLSPSNETLSNASRKGYQKKP